MPIALRRVVSPSPEKSPGCRACAYHSKAGLHPDTVDETSASPEVFHGADETSAMPDGQGMDRPDETSASQGA